MENGISVFTLVTSLCFPIFLSSCGLEVPQFGEETENSVEQNPDAYPIEKTLTNKKGVVIEAVIVGREIDKIWLVRQSDQRQFQYPIDDLSSEDRKFAKDLPLLRPSDTEMARMGNSTSGRGPQVFLQSRIDELTNELDLAQTELRRYGPGTMKKKSLYKEILRMKEELHSLRLELEELKNR